MGLRDKLPCCGGKGNKGKEEEAKEEALEAGAPAEEGENAEGKQKGEGDDRVSEGEGVETKEVEVEENKD